jgi:hypothetical protein
MQGKNGFFFIFFAISTLSYTGNRQAKGLEYLRLLA